MQFKHYSKKKMGNIISKIFIILFLLIEIYPILWMFIASLKSPGDFAVLPSYALPSELNFKNYSFAWTTGRIRIFFVNSMITTLVSLFFIISFSSMASFALIKMKWRGQQIVMMFFLLGIMVPTTIVLLPLFQIYLNLKLINSYWSLIITYTGFGVSLSIFLISQYMRSMPDELIEAAVMDGCNIYSIFLKIVLPLIKNAIVTVIIIQFFFRWNDLIFSMTFITKTSMRTIQTGLLYFSDEYGNRNWGGLFAAITMGITPTLLLYILLNKFVIKGMTAGAIKG